MGLFKKPKKKGNGTLQRTKSKLLALKIAAYTLPVVLLFVVLGGVLISMFFMGVVSVFTLFKGDETVEEEQHSGDCPCGCVWVSSDKSVANVETVTSNGKRLESIGVVTVNRVKLSTAQDSSQGAEQSNQDSTQGTEGEVGSETVTDNTTNGNQGDQQGSQQPQTASTSSGADRTVGITLSANQGTLDKLGLKLGDWVYISSVGTYQVQDIVNDTQDTGTVTIYTDSTSDKSEHKIYLIESGTITSGSQANVTPPAIDVSSVDIPSYGSTTGSLTDTSTEGKFSGFRNQNEEILVNAILPGATVISQYLDVNICMTLGKAPIEGGRDCLANPEAYGYQVFSLIGTGPLTGGYKPGSKRWSSHLDFEEACIHYGMNFHKLIDHKNTAVFNGYFSQYGYRDILEAYPQGYKAQIEAMRLSGYNQYKGSTIEEYIANSIKYTNDILSVAEPLEAFNNIDFAMAYIKEHGMLDRYNKALEYLEIYKGLDRYKGVKTYRTTPNTGSSMGSTDPSAGTSTGGGAVSTNGHWVCVCDIPCDKCDCHTGESQTNGTQSGSASGTFPTSTAGVASGLWGDTAQLKEYISQLTSANVPIGTKNVESLKKNLLNLIQYIGAQPAKMYSHKIDRFKGTDGYGFIRYDQRKSSAEPFLNAVYNDGSATFRSSGCGLYSMAMALSTLEKKWVNPAEVAIALSTYGVRNGDRVYSYQMGGSQGAVISSAIKPFFEELGYKVDYSTACVDQTKLDNCLSSGGVFIYVLRDSGTIYSSGTEGHFVVIREKTPNGTYLMGDSIAFNDNEFSFDTIENSWKHTSVYIYPRAGLPSAGGSNGAQTDNSQQGGSQGDGSQNGSQNGSQGGSQGGSDLRNQICTTVRAQLGIPYVVGGSSPSKGFDCSGLTSYVYKQNGISIPRTALEQYKGCVQISREDLQPGDLVFFKTFSSSKAVTHVGIFTDSHSGTFIHSPDVGDVVKTANIDSSYWQKAFVSGGRYF